MLGGTIKIFLAEALLLPTGIITAAFLTRKFGPEGYGLFTLSATIIAWIGWSLTSIFTRATIKFVGETEDWRPVGTTVLRLHLWVGGGAMLLIWLLADGVAMVLREEAIALYLRLFALDIPLFCLAYAHRSILVGVGKFSQRAIATALRWIARLLLILLLVEMGLSISGAILGSVGASLVELAICRFYIRPSPFAASNFPARKLWDYGVPLFLFALSMRLYEKLDLFALKILGGTAADAGFYGAAQNLSLIPGIFSLAFAPLLLSTLTRTLYAGDRDSAKKISRDAMGAVLLMLPFAGMTAGAAPEIVTLIFGKAFLPAAPLLAVLIFGALGLAMISITTAILTAAGKPDWTFILTAPLLPLAIIGYWFLIPLLGAMGASIAFAAFAILGALVTVLAVYRLLQVFPPITTLCRTILVSGLAYVLAANFTVDAGWVVVKLLALALAILLALLLSGEFSKSEIISILGRMRLPISTHLNR
ncbi:lipopolysaccharide biosynthesis protein [Microseira sp. BLCC-F43]|jgi:O-antigen/teichoic acid export membrane protein|uniref:lipopolysaccharide biosynthesis protein n=1 Tax=Microseira sp. BLCC-F43 TaxID=3153602 RepID=UPI0035B810CC